MVGSSPALAQQHSLKLPALTAPTADASAGQLNGRAEAVVRLYACGVEPKYADVRRRLMAEDFEAQGEGINEILLAKMAWLTDPRFSGGPCEANIRYDAAPGAYAGDTSEERIEKFQDAMLGAWRKTGALGTCSYATSQINATETRITVKVTATPACLRSQINEALQAMYKASQMGTPLPVCLDGNWPFHEGEYDATVRDLIALLYMGKGGRLPVLDGATVSHMYEHLLSARGPLGPAEYSVMTGCTDPAGEELGTPEDYADQRLWYNEVLDSLDDPFEWLHEFLAKLGGGLIHSGLSLAAAPIFVVAGEDPTKSIVPHNDVEVAETENHRLMIESTRYLTNAAIIEELERIGHSEVDSVREDQTEVRNWLLQQLQRIGRGDFEEYNAKPYTRYSLIAVTNLCDFSPDASMRTAAQIVLDRSAAKFASGSNQGRRLVPFRRLADSEAPEFYHFIGGADHEVVRAVVLAGQTGMLSNSIPVDAASPMVHSAISQYRLPRAVLEAAIERTKPYSQDVRHAGIESYYSSPSFTMSVGGIQIPAALNFYGIERSVDRGTAVPTLLIPALPSPNLSDVFRFDGVGTQHERTANLCGWKGFICGIAPSLDTFACGQRLPETPGYRFISSARCPQASPASNFYLAARTFQCTTAICGEGHQGLLYGIAEMVEASAAVAGPDPIFEGFVTNRKAALGAVSLDANGHGTYRNVSGETIGFIITPWEAAVSDIDGSSRIVTDTKGLLTVTGSKITIQSPVSSWKVDADVSDWANPVRTESQ
jgi:hypothetical protein